MLYLLNYLYFECMSMKE